MARSPSDDLDRKLYASILTKCVASGCLSHLKSLLRARSDLNMVDEDGTPLLHYAVANTNTDVLEYLLEEGLYVDARDENDSTALHACASLGPLANMCILIAHGANIRAKDKYGSTALHHAASRVDSSELIECLIREGANIEEKNTSGLTAFHLCARLGNVEGMVSLIRGGAKFLERGVTGETALHHAVLDETSRAIEYLLTQDIAIDASDEHGITPVIFCASRGSVKNTKLLVEAGADVKAVNKGGFTALHLAMTKGSAPGIIRYLVEEGISPDSRDEEGNTPLHMCALSGSLQICKELLEMGADMEIKNEIGRTALHNAAVNQNNAGVLAFLVNKGMSMDARDNFGNAPIHFCASQGPLMNMQILVRKGCDIEMKNAVGFTPLLCAYSNANSREMIEYLLSQGAAINTQDAAGNSPLHHSAKQGTKEMVKFLVDNGADIRASNSAGLTALHIAMCSNTHDVIEYLQTIQASRCEMTGSNDQAILPFIKKGNLQNLKMLFDQGFDIRCTDEEGQTALHYAVANEEPGVIELILNHGISLEVRSNDGVTPLISCAAEGTLQNLMLLVKKGANVYARDRMGKTAIHYAVINTNAAAILEFLLKRGLSIEARDNLGRTPLHLCCNSGSLENMKTLVDMRASINAKANNGLTALHFAASNEKTSQIIGFLLDRGLPIEARNDLGITPLHYSIMHGTVGNMKLLIEKGASLQARTKNNTSVIEMAVAYGEAIEKLQHLINKGASIHEKDSNGRTPLHMCAAEGNLQTMKFLIKKGADIRERDKHGITSLHFAATNKKTTTIIQYLLNQGISLEVKDKLGLTPLLFAAERGNLKGVLFLCEKGADLKSVDNLKMTALHHAATNDEGGPVIEYLLARGLSVDVRNAMGLSPLDMAKTYGVVANEKILLENHASSDDSNPVGTDASLMALMLALMNQQMR